MIVRPPPPPTRARPRRDGPPRLLRLALECAAAAAFVAAMCAAQALFN